MVFWQLRQHHIRDLLSEVEVLGIPCITIDHGVTINRPSLSAAPQRIVVITLMVAVSDMPACDCIIDSDMVDGSIFPEMIPHRGVGMTHGNPGQPSVVCAALPFFKLLIGPEEQFKIDHVVDDGVMSAEHAHIPWPGEQGAYTGIEEGGQSVGRINQHLSVMVFGGLVSIAFLVETLPSLEE